MSNNGLFSVIKRLIVGEPGFVPSDEMETPKKKKRREVDDWDAPADSDPVEPVDQLPPIPEQSKFHDESGNKLQPVALIERVETKVRQNDMDVWALIRNNSEFNLEIDKVELLGQRRDMNQYLSPGQERQILIYTGDMPKNTSTTTGYLFYKLVDNGDMFVANHYVKYNQEDDGYYSIEELQFQPPVRDI